MVKAGMKLRKVKNAEFCRDENGHCIFSDKQGFCRKREWLTGKGVSKFKCYNIGRYELVEDDNEQSES